MMSDWLTVSIDVQISIFLLGQEVKAGLKLEEHMQVQILIGNQKMNL
jgi:hypothetical protein